MAGISRNDKSDLSYSELQLDILKAYNTSTQREKEIMINYFNKIIPNTHNTIDTEKTKTKVKH